MPIEVELPDGSIAEFPDGTDSATMERALASYSQAPARDPSSSSRGKPDFSNVSGGVQSSERGRGERKPRLYTSEAYDAGTASRGGVRDVVTGVGQSLDTAGRGVRQGLVEGTAGVNALQAKLAGAMGMDGARDNLLAAGAPLREYSGRLREQNTQRRADNAELGRSFPAAAGNALGTIGQFVGPGILARGTAAGAALLPTTVRGNALQGALVGGLQPYTSRGEQAANTGLGTLAGTVGAGAPALAGRISRAIPRGGLTGAERAAGKQLRNAVGDRQPTVTPSEVPGVRRSVGEATLDPGLMALERNARRLRPQAFTENELGNNAARVNALRGIAGDDAQMDAAVQAREAAASPFYDAARNATAPVDQGLKDAIAKLPPSVVRKARELARMEGVSTPGQAGAMTGSELHYLKLALDDELSKVGPGSMGNVQRRVLMGVKDGLVDNIGRLIPEYQQGMAAFEAGSGPINRMQVGQELIERGRASQDDALGNPNIQPGRFGTIARNLEPLAQRATGFKRARVDQILSTDDMKTISAVNDDLRRQAARATNPVQPGSATMEATSLAGQIGQRGLMSAIGRGAPFVGDMIQSYQRGADDRLWDQMAQLLSDPAAYQRVMQSLPPAKAQALERALVATGGLGARSAAAE